MAENLRTRQVTYIADFGFPFRLRPHHRKSTGSRPITAVKPCRARLVPGWETAWEYPVL